MAACCASGVLSPTETANSTRDNQKPAPASATSQYHHTSSQPSKCTYAITLHLKLIRYCSQTPTAPICDRIATGRTGRKHAKPSANQGCESTICVTLVPSWRLNPAPPQ